MATPVETMTSYQHSEHTSYQLTNAYNGPDYRFP